VLTPTVAGAMFGTGTGTIFSVADRCTVPAASRAKGRSRCEPRE